MTKIDEIPLYQIIHFFDKLPQSYFFNSSSPHNVVLIRINRYIPDVNNRVPFIFLKRKGKKGLESVNHEVLKRFEKEFQVTNNKLCKYYINQSYTKSGYLDSDVSVILFNDARKSKRSTISKYTFGQTIYGILFLEEDPKDKYTFYLNLVCSKKGLGSLLLKFCETIGTYFDYDKIGLSSVDTPMSFYIYKNYLFKAGKERFQINNRIDIDPYEIDKLTNRIVVKKALQRVGYFTEDDQNTRIVGFPKATRSRRLQRKVKRSLKRVGALRNVSLNSDGNVKMFKKVQHQDKVELKALIGDYSEDNLDLYKEIEILSFNHYIQKKYKKKLRPMLKYAIKEHIKSKTIKTANTLKPKSKTKTKPNSSNSWENITNNNNN